MVMKTLSISEAKAKFSEVVDAVLAGKEVVVTRMGAPMVKIVRYQAEQDNKRLGLFEGQIEMAADFDEWPEAEAEALGIKE
jgi:prevent-host-death family protein